MTSPSSATLRQTNSPDSFLEDYFSKNFRQFPFRRSGLGSSGFTFLPLSSRFEWVIKWQTPYQTECEYLCTQFYRRSFEHLSVPDVRLVVDKSLIKKMLNYFKKDPEGEKIVDYYTPLLMQYKDGNNLFYSYRESYLFKLTPSDLRLLFVNFGEMIGYDMVIANSDRFFPPRFKGQIDKGYRVNSGNVMIEFIVPDTATTEDETRTLKAVHSIDNAPLFLELFDRVEKKYIADDPSDDLFEGGFSLFGDSDEDESPISSTTHDATTPQKTGDALRRERLEDLRYFCSGDQAIQALAQQTVIGVINELTTPTNKNNESAEKFEKRAKRFKAFINDPQNMTPVLEGLIEGMKQAITHLKEDKTMGVVKELEDEQECTHENSKTLLTFVSENLNYIQKL